MLDIPEYDLENTDSLVVLTEDDVVSDSERKWFRRQLKRIAGTAPNGFQNLELRWGPTYRDPMSADNNIKYLDFMHRGQQLGERRFFIEIYRSPEFLKRSDRYRQTHAPDVVQEFYFCRACDAEIKCDAALLELLGSVPPCPKCGSNRSRTELIRESGGGRLLNDFPTNGCYDYWLRLERANLTYHPPDYEALKVIEALWQFEKNPENQRNALEQGDRELERRQMIMLQRQQTTTRVHFSSEPIQFDGNRVLPLTR
jgi:hypothetical protein